MLQSALRRCAPASRDSPLRHVYRRSDARRRCGSVICSARQGEHARIAYCARAASVAGRAEPLRYSRAWRSTSRRSSHLGLLILPRRTHDRHEVRAAGRPPVACTRRRRHRRACGLTLLRRSGSWPLRASEVAFAVKIVARSISSDGHPTAAQPAGRRRAGCRRGNGRDVPTKAARQGLLTDLSNPKVGAFFTIFRSPCTRQPRLFLLGTILAADAALAPLLRLSRRARLDVRRPSVRRARPLHRRRP